MNTHHRDGILDHGEEGQKGEEGREENNQEGRKKEEINQQRQLIVFMQALNETMRALETVRASTSSVLVAYSDGKDARCVMDLALKTFERVEGFYMYFLPDMECVATGIEQAKKMWGVPIHMVPHWSGLMALKHGVYSFGLKENEYEIPQLSLWNIYASMIKLTGIPVILTGFKRADSNSRARYLKWTSHNKQIIHPIAGWRKHDVVGFLKSRNIKLPSGSDLGMANMDLTHERVLWLHDNYPDDYKIMLRFFPFVGAIVSQREFYGP